MSFDLFIKLIRHDPCRMTGQPEVMEMAQQRMNLNCFLLPG